MSNSINYSGLQLAGECPPDSTPIHESSHKGDLPPLPVSDANPKTPFLKEFEATQAALLRLRGLEGAARVELERRLAESLDRLRSLHLGLADYLENGNIGLHKVGPDGRILWANKAELDLLGYTWEEYVGHPITEFHADQSVIQDILTRLTNCEKLSRVPARLRAKDGSIKRVLINTSMRVESGQPLHTRCFTVDVTATERLAEENAVLRAALDAAPDGVAVSMGDSLVYVNPAQAQRSGHTQPEKLLGTSWINLQMPEVQAFLEGNAFPTLRQHGHWRGALPVQRRGGSTFVDQLTLQALSDGHIISVASDITELEAASKKLSAAHDELSIHSEHLRQLNEQLEAAARMKDEFMATMSHELRTPLTAMLGMTDVLRDQIQGPLLPAQQRCVEVIASSSHHLLRLINDILDLSKLGARMLELDLAPISASRVCQAAVEIVQPLADAKGIELTVQLDPFVGNLRADERRVRQILVNLLGNAIKFTSGQGKVRLSVTTEAAERLVRFSVTDTGVGIPAESLQMVFEPFKQLHTGLARNHEGTGLGLPLARQLAELHGGHLTVESTVGQGSCFTLSLPRGDNSLISQPSSSPSGSVQKPKPEPERDRYRVLLVDDNKANLEAVQTYLDAKGWVVITADCGAEAIAIFEKSAVDLILMDIQMPGMDGLEAIGHIRRLPRGQNIPIIALTALAMANDREKCLTAGADHYVSKPASLATLTQLMHQCLSKSNP
jgi:PAS domain S-box-containing protein